MKLPFGAFAFYLCFLFGAASFVTFNYINQPTRVVAACEAIEAQDSQFAITVHASDFALRGKGTPDDPFILDRVGFVETLRRLDTVPVKKVVDGGCHYYHAGGNSIKVFSNTFISRFIVIDDGLRNTPALEANNVTEVVIKNNTFLHEK